MLGQRDQVRLAAVAGIMAVLASGCAFIGRASISTSGAQANRESTSPAISGTGRYVAFDSNASNLVSGDTNGVSDVFLRDVVTGTTSRMSVANGSGAQANDVSFDPSVSSDGRYVAFASDASNLVAGDTPHPENPAAGSDIFVRDRMAGTTTRASISTAGTEGTDGSGEASVSDDGRYVVFSSRGKNLVPGDSNELYDIFVRDLVAGTTTMASVDNAGVQSNGQSFDLSIAADGHSVAFHSDASNLVPGDTNGLEDVFVRDLAAGTTVRVSIGNAGAEANARSSNPSMSGDGNHVAFSSTASNLTAGDTNGAYDIFVRDLLAGTTTRVSVSTAGVQANAPSSEPSISDDGRYVAFASDASNLVPFDTNGEDVFVRDRLTGTTVRSSTAFTGAQQADAGAFFEPAISGDGRYVAFDSEAANLVAGDTNEWRDIFVKRVTTPGATSIAPPSGARGTTAVHTVTGTGFVPGMTATLGTGVQVLSTTYVTETELELQVEVLSTAPLGARTLTVVDDGTIGPGTGGIGFCSDCFTVTD